MEIISWNVNGIRACIRKGMFDFMKKAEVYCFQETKIHKEDVKEEHKKFSDYQSYWFSAERKGYSGVVTYTKTKPVKVMKGIGIKKFDDEGRVLTLEYNNFYLINIYFPNSGRELKRLDFKLEFNKELLKYVEKLRKKKNVVMCGDFNVAHKEIDLKNPKSNKKNAGFTIEERNSFTKILEQDYVDVFRQYNKEPNQYTWWSYRFNAREKNVGWRIDYFVVNKKFMEKVKSSKILKQVMGSDHCPISLNITTD
jgi:exodeoxyribonuclease-3